MKIGNCKEIVRNLERQRKSEFDKTIIDRFKNRQMKKDIQSQYGNIYATCVSQANIMKSPEFKKLASELSNILTDKAMYVMGYALIDTMNYVEMEKARIINNAFTIDLKNV